MALVAISVPFETLQPGMVLAEPVLNRLGQILMSKGSALSLRHLTVLKTWGISTAVIEGGEAEGNDPILDQAIQDRALARIKTRLFWHPQSPLEKEIIHLAVEQAVQRSLQGSS
jgi:hypothetical protein